MKASLSTSKAFKDTGFFILEEGDLQVDIAIENRRQGAEIGRASCRERV